MATWEDVGVNNYRDAVALFETKKYRSSTSRFYYAVFALLTHELTRRGAANDFAQSRATPSHRQLPRLVQDHLTQFSEERLRNMARRISSLYRNRIEADYSLLRVDRVSAKESYRLAESLFRYLGVKL